MSADISIARNYQITVKPVSILGKRGYFDEISENFVDYTGKGRKIRTSETDRGDNFIPTEKLIQVITALIPVDLWPYTEKAGEHWNKAFSYSSATGPMKLFGSVYKRAKDQEAPDEHAKRLYEFYVQIASSAWKLYEGWGCHQGFKGFRFNKWHYER